MQDDSFKCKVTTWDYIYDLCRDVADQVKEAGFEPDMVVALARGGWFPGRVLCDLLGLDDLESLKIEHYVGTAETGEDPHIKYPVAEESVEGKDVLLVDDITDTGKSLKWAVDHLEEEHDPAEVEVAVLQFLDSSTASPDYVGEELEEWAWMVYPWNFVEDMVDLVGRVLSDEPMTLEDVRRSLKEQFELDRVWFEVAEPNRMEEVMDEAVRLDVAEEVEVETPFGPPSDSVIVGDVEGVETAFVPRHGRSHLFSPTDVPYHANIYALKKLGVERVIGINAVGSLRGEVEPLHFLVPDQIYDRTKLRDSTFFGGGVVAHIGFADPFCPEVGDVALQGSRDVGVETHGEGTYVCIEGPSFSTEAESEVYRGQGHDVIGMTAIPEAKLAREAELCYSMITTVTDYDVWHDEEVSVELVVERAQQNEENVKDALAEIIPEIPEERGCSCGSALEGAVMTDLSVAPEETLERLDLLIGRFRE